MIRRLTCALVLLLPSLVSANVMFIGDPMPLSDLTAGQTLTVGDKVFSDFSYLAAGDVPTAEFVNVQGIMDDHDTMAFASKARSTI